ncbi:MAG TPA: hypothetical protein VHD88_00065 [Pyrinomonadaceae bacterium]|nr:hypothetical protein [Pyrinomonadaceae bacterium]
MTCRLFYKIVPALTLMVALSLLIPRPSQACGPFFTVAIFVYTKHPDMPLERFAAGQLGVLRPTYARSYLVAAYRNLIDRQLSDAEAKGLDSLWEDRLSSAWEFHDDEFVKKWLNARKQVPGIAPPGEIHAFRNREKPHEYESFLNCQQDAFVNAEATLNERIKRFGAGSPAVSDWLSAQDIVFANCGSGKQIPEAARADQDALIRADRAYQIAASNFYAGNFDEAKQQFDSIAHDQASPWHEMAGYLAARALLRKGSLAEKEEEGRPALAEAETRLKAIVKDKALASSHHAAARLLNLVRLRLHPEEKLHELALALITKDASADFKQDVWDYTVLLDKFVGDDEKTNKRAIPTSVKSEELTDWVLTLQDASAEASTHSFDRWEKTKATRWLLVAMMKANAKQPNLEALLKAAAGIDHALPAFATVAFHSVRLLMESGRTSEARTMITGIPANDRQTLPASAVNVFLSQQMSLAQNLNEFLQSAQRAPAGFSDNSDGRELPEDEKELNATTKGSLLFFDLDSVNILNRGTPVGVLRDAARGTILAANLRSNVAQAAFMRAALLDDRDNAAQAAVVLGTVNPELKESLAAYQRAATPEAKRFSVAYLSLKFPGLRPYVTAGVGRATPVNEIDSYRDNWWCAEPPTSMSGAAWQGEDETQKANARPLALPEFLKPSQSLAAKQLATLEALGTGPNYLCRTAIDWTNQNPTDPRAPEALHLAVKATRYGCTDKDTGRWSKAAFDLLHRRYPNSSWAKETKYWFKG